MPTGSRSLDKRALASLVVVRHLGDADRRNMYETSLTNQNAALILLAMLRPFRVRPFSRQ